MNKRLALSAVTLVAVAATLLAAAAPAQTLIIPSTARARLEGAFKMTGRINQAVDVDGEHQGEIVHRTWTFTPNCSAGVCHKIRLARRRANGTDHLILIQHSPGYYTGSGSFYAPLGCAGSYWRRGALVPFTITVRITAAAVVNGVVVASKVRAYYHNSVRYNETPCVVSTLGHDDAEYHGVPAVAAAR